MIDRRTQDESIVVYVDDDAKSSHFEDAKRREVLVNKRVMLSGENKPNQRCRLFFIWYSVKISVLM